MKQFDASIALNVEVSPSWRVLAFTWPIGLVHPVPGQFFTFRPKALASGDSALLRRPLAFAGFDGTKAYCLYQVRGPGTNALAKLCEGEEIDIIAPLGKGFPMPGSEETPVLAAGGIGIGPILFLASGITSKLFLGFRNELSIPQFNFPGIGSVFEASINDSIISTDDGSRGIRGSVRTALEVFFKPNSRQAIHIYACGPKPMLASIAEFAAKRNAPAHVSVEQWMACGVGACHGCVVPSSTGGYLRACADGPVFESSALAWKE